MGSLRVAGIGAGYFAQFHYEAWSRSADASLVGICDEREDQAAAAAAKYAAGCWVGRSAAAMLDEVRPDIFDIVTPPHTHHALVRLAIARGVRVVICQKPLAPTLREARAIVEEAEEGFVQV